MKASFNIAVAALMAVSACGALKAEGPKALFKVTFDGGNADADIAAGHREATLENPAKDPDAKLEFEPSLPGYGSALVIGEKNLGLSYDLVGNARYDRGSLSFWFRRVGPRPKSDQGTLYRYDVLQWQGDDGASGLVYKWEHYGNMTLLRYNRGAPTQYTMTLSGDADDGNWHLITFTWAGTQMRAYFDGQFSCAQEKFVLPTLNRLLVGDFHDLTKGEACRRLLDDITIYGETLTSSEVKRLYREGRGLDAPSTLTIPPRKHAIKIDGKISPEEWEGAVETSGFADWQTGLYVATQTHAKLCYDDQAFYLALSSEFPQRVKDDAAMTIGMTGALRQTCDKFDANVDSDDSFEVHLEPPVSPNRYYRFVVNGLNVHYDYEVTGDYRHGQNGNTRLDWNPKWETASLLDGEGWHMEIRIPFADFGVPAPKPGDTWGLSLLRRWLALRQGTDGWGFNSRAPNFSYGHETVPVKFGSPDTPVVQLKGWGRVHEGFVNLESSVTNPSDTDLSLKVDIASDSKELREARELTIPRKGNAPVTASAKLKDFTTSQVTMTVSRKNGEVVFRSGELLCIPEELKVNTAHYPSKGILRIDVDAGRLSDLPLSELALVVQMKDRNGKAVLPETRLSPLPSYRNSSTLDIARVPPGAYTVQCGIMHKGKDIFDRKIDFEKKPLPEWYGNPIGITDKAPKPFTPIVRDGETVKCWGREYRFGQSLFPEQIVTQGQEMLAGPIELMIFDASGKKLNAGNQAVPDWKKHTDFRVEFTRRVKDGPVKVETTNWLECDGLLWTTLRVLPTETEIGKLVVRVPFKKEWSEYINTYDYSVRTTGRLKTAGWQQKDNPLWLGNPTGGLQWITETLAPCRLAEKTLPVQVKVGPKENVFELTLIDVPAKLTRPFEVSWGWVATPVRPPTPGYRGWATGLSDIAPGYSGQNPERLIYDPRWLTGVPSKDCFYPRKLPRADGRGDQNGSAGPYIVIGQCLSEVPEAQYWADEWSPSRFGRQLSGETFATSPAAQSWADYLVWTRRQLYDRARFIGLYYDCAMYYPDDNAYHGSGYRTEDGSIQSTNGILATRRLVQRMYCMLRGLEPDQTMIVYHHSGMINMAVLSWCDVYADGENFDSRLNKQDVDYHRVFPPDAFLAQSMGHNFGPTTWFLDEFTRSHAVAPADWKTLGIQPVTHLYGLILLHDSTYWKSYGNPEAYKAVEDALVKYHFDEDYRMIPYWNQKIISLPDKVFATFYRNDKTHTVLVVLLNNNEEDLNLKLKLDWKALGFDDPQALRVDDPIFKGQPTIVNSELTTAVGRANMRLLAILPR